MGDIWGKNVAFEDASTDDLKFIISQIDDMPQYWVTRLISWTTGDVMYSGWKTNLYETVEAYKSAIKLLNGTK
jgi:hypothetical protein